MGVNVTAKEVEGMMVDSMVLKDRETWEREMREGKGKGEDRFLNSRDVSKFGL